MNNAINAIVNSSHILDFLVLRILSFSSIAFSSAKKTERELKSLDNNSLRGQVDKSGLYAAIFLILGFVSAIILVPMMFILIKVIGISENYWFFILMFFVISGTIFGIKNQCGEYHIQTKKDIEKFFIHPLILIF